MAKFRFSSHGLCIRVALGLLLFSSVHSCELLADNQDELFAIIKNGKYGFINQHGKIIIKPRYIWAEGLGGHYGSVYVCGHYLTIDSSGTLLPSRTGQMGLDRKQEGDKFGFVDSSGQFKIKPVFDDALSFSEGLAAVEIAGKWGFIDIAGNLVIHPQFNYAFYFADGVGVAVSDSGYLVIDRTGKVLASGFEDVQLPSEGRVPVLLKDSGKAGFLDLQGNVVIPLIYDAVNRFSGGLAAVIKGDKVGYIGRDGNVVIPIQFDFARDFSMGLAPVKIGKKSGFIDTSGKFAFYLKFDGSDSFPHGIDVATFWTEDNKSGYVNTAGKVIWKPTRAYPSHPPIFGWSTEDIVESCEGIPAGLRDKILAIPY